MASLPGVFNVQAFTDAGAPAASYRLYTYAAGTTTHKTAYTDAAGLVAHTYTSDGAGGQFIGLNARGELPAPLFLASGAYDLTLKTPAGATVWTRYASGSEEGAVAAFASFVADLADDSSATKGAGLIGYSGSLSYAADTVGAAVKALGKVLTGADNTGATDSTAVMRAFFDACIPDGLEAIIPAGTYLISGPISNPTTIAAGSLNVRCLGDVTINVSGSATAFSRVLSCETTAANNVIIRGNLTINANNKAGSGLYARHYGQGGQVLIESVKVTDCKNVNFGVENGGVYLYGRWAVGRIGVIEVNGVDRTGSGTAARGVLIADAGGPFTVQSLKVSNVLSTGFTADADGLYFSGYTSGASTSQREGSLTVERAEFVDCQGRSIKIQHQDVTIRDCIVRRQAVATFSPSSPPDIDFQLGGGQIDNLLLQYIKQSGTSLLHSSFYPIASQHTCTDRATVCRIGKVTLRAEMQLPRLVQIIVGSTALDGATYVEDVDLVPFGSFTGGFFSRCAVEFDAGQVAASSNKTHISARSIRGDMTGKPMLGHTGFTTGVTNVSAKLSVEVIDNANTGTATADNKVIGATSGNDIPAFLQFNFRGNTGFHALMMPTFTFNTQTLADGCAFSYVRATATVTNGPTISAGTYVDVECLGSINGTSRKVRMTVDNGGTMDEWYTQSGAWGVIK